MALDWLRRPNREPGLPSEPSDGGSQWGGSSQDPFAQLFEQAKDLNNELCRENCELRREAAMLRQRRAPPPNPTAAPQMEGVARAQRVAGVLPRVMSQVRCALQVVGPPPQPIADDLEMLAAIEDAVRHVLVEAADAARAEVALASNEETAALVSEKVALKELSLRNKERLLELGLAKDKASGHAPGHWASRISHALSGSKGESPIAAMSTPPAFCAERPLPPQPLQVLSVGDLCEVVGRNGAILRRSEDLDGAKVDTIPPGSRVRILEFGAAGSRRARVVALAAPPEEGVVGDISEPPSGWLSVTTKDGKELIRPILVHDPSPAAGALADSGAGAADVASGANGIGAADCSESDAAGGDDAPAPGAFLEASPLDRPALAPGASSEQVAQSRVLRHARTEGDMPSGHSHVPTAEEDGCQTSTPAVSASLTTFSRQSSSGFEQGPRPKSAMTVSTVTVSTDAWLALRNDRNLRERQIKDLEERVGSARYELGQLNEVRAHLREQRSLALSARWRGNEHQESARMAYEELLVLRADIAESRGCLPAAAGNARLDASATGRGGAEARDNADAAGTATAPADVADASVTKVAGDSITGDVPRHHSVEWRRLLSERETTARELARILERTEELEGLVEERRIEMQVAEKRRQRERRSLLTALRELGADDMVINGSDDEASEDVAGDRGLEEAVGKSDGDGHSLPRGAAVANRENGVKASRLQGAKSHMSSPKTGLTPTAREQHYLQRISELEETVGHLRNQLEALQVREATLNRSAVVRGGALRYATTLAGATAAAEDGDPASAVAERRRGERSEMESLVRLLEGLFVENFALGGGSAGARAPTGRSRLVDAAAATPPSVASVDGAATSPDESGFMDLDRFVIDEDAASDDEGVIDLTGEAGTHDALAIAQDDDLQASRVALLPLLEPGHHAPVLQAATGSAALGAPRASEPGGGLFPRSTEAKRSRSPSPVPSETPRTRLLRSFDFGKLSVKE
mmetsp:Transcript_76940/g.213789  ORF Transcript_76940/g.213789 Transcript_76940/m.213789 type:complete len:989 (-) Transcript_76940:72-3038(-)